MKKLLLKLSFFFLPLLLIGVVSEFLLRRIPNESRAKANGLKINGGSIEVLCLGSSHPFFGIEPSLFDRPTFNAAEPSQSVDVDLALFDHYKKDLPKLKYVLISVSSFTFTFTFENSEDKWRAKNYRLYHHIKISNELKYTSEVFSVPAERNIDKLIHYYRDHNNFWDVDEFGGLTNNFRTPTEQEMEWEGRSSAMRHNGRFTKSDSVKSRLAMTQLIEECKEKNIEVIIYIPPAYKTYTSVIDANRIADLRNTASNFERKYNNVHYYDLLNDPSFGFNDFRDGDHLNHNGAVRLSRKLNDIIVSLDK